MQLSWINIAKGIGIICVVLGHLYGGLLNRFIYLFHMPFFFLISGFLFKPQNKKTYLNKKVIRLLVPYIMFLMILYPLYYDYSNEKNLLNYIGKAIIGGKILNRGLIIFWFITCLFLTQQFFNVLASYMKSIKKLSLVAAIILMLSYYISNVFPLFWLPWSAEVILMSTPLFFVGYLLKQKPISLKTPILIIGIIICITCAYYFENLAFDMKNNFSGIPLLSFLLSIFIFLFIKSISEKIQTKSIISKQLEIIGKRSIIIMFLHQPLILLLRNYIDLPIFFIFIISLLIPCFFYYIFSLSKYTKILFLGEK